MYDAFNSIDANCSGTLTNDEFRRIIQSRGFYVSDKEATEIVEKMDKNKDGRVTFSEVSLIFKNSCLQFCDDITNFNQLSLSERQHADKTFVTTYLTLVPNIVN